MSRELICCWSVRRWSLIVAVFQVILNVGFLTFGIVCYVAEATSSAVKIPELLTDTERERAKRLAIPIILVGLNLVFTSTLGIILGAMLYEGILHRNWRRLGAWLLCTFALTLLNSIVVLEEFARKGGGIRDGAIFFGVCIHIVFILIIQIHKEQLKDEERWEERVKSLLAKVETKL